MFAARLTTTPGAVKPTVILLLLLLVWMRDSDTFITKAPKFPAYSPFCRRTLDCLSCRNISSWWTFPGPHLSVGIHMGKPVDVVLFIVGSDIVEYAFSKRPSTSFTSSPTNDDAVCEPTTK